MDKAYRPLSLEEALDLRNSRITTVCAGGSDLLVRHRVWSGLVPRLPHPALMIGHLKELREIGVWDTSVQIGACCTLAEILKHREVPEQIKLPLRQMASPAVRTIATMGGNIVNASPAGDTLPMLYALDARLTLQSQSRTVVVHIADFITGAGSTILGDDQIVTKISIPQPCFPCFQWEKVASRRANAISKLSLYAAARVSGEVVEEIRIAFGALSATVVRSREAENLLSMVPRARIPELFEEVQKRYAALMTPIDDLRSTRDYRQGVALDLLAQFLSDVRTRE